MRKRKRQVTYFIMICVESDVDSQDDDKSKNSPEKSPKKPQVIIQEADIEDDEDEDIDEDIDEDKDEDEVNPNEVKLDMENSKEKEANYDSDGKKSKKGAKTTGIDSSNRVMSQSGLSAGGSEFGDEEVENNSEAVAKKEKTEEELEAEKQVLLKMEWNNTFHPDYFNEEERFHEANQSEKQAYERQVRTEKELGRKIWNLIGYIAFFAIFSYLVFSHVRVSMFNMYNDALKNNIEGVTVESQLDNFINITEVSTYQEMTDWLVYAMPFIIDTEREGTDGNPYYFINDYNYVLENRVRV
jgi:hypothetical protein